MGIIAAAMAGLLVGFMMKNVAAAFALALSVGLLVKVGDLSRQFGQLQQQLQRLQAQAKAEVSDSLAVAADSRVENSESASLPSLAPSVAPVPDSKAHAPLESPAIQALVSDPYVRRADVAQKTVTQQPPAGASSHPSQSAAPSEPSSAPNRWAQSALGQRIARVNLITRVGIVILFLGISFLVKFASESVTVSIELRLALIAFGALIVFFIGWRLRNTRREYALLLQGAAVGSGYLVTFAAMKVYMLLPASLGFFALLGLSVLAALLSVKQDAKSLAVFGILGGFLAPVLASTGGGSHVMLFSYYAILNAGIVVIVWFKAWRVLTLMGFAFTFIISVVWGGTRYSNALFASTEPFLLLFILFYIAVVMIFALRKQWAHHHLLDGPLVFGTPVIGFTLQAMMVRQFEYGLAWSALGFGAFYLLVTAIWWRLMAQRSPLLRESFLAIGLIFSSLAIPFAFDHDVTALAWALEGGGAMWLAVRQQRNWGCLLSVAALFGAGCSWLLDSPASGEQLFLNAGYLSGAVIALVGFYGAWLLRDQPATLWCRRLHGPLLMWSLIWWFALALWQLHRHVPHATLIAAALLFFSISCVVFNGLRKRYRWSALAPVVLGLLPVSALALLTSAHFVHHPFAALGYIAWPVLVGSLYWIYLGDRIFTNGLVKLEVPAHFASYLMVTAVLGWEVLWRIDQHASLASWHMIGLGLTLFAAIRVSCKLPFSAGPLQVLYQQHIVALYYSAIALMVLFGCLIQPNVLPMPYIPLLNALDLWQISMLLCLLLFWKKHSTQISFLPPSPAAMVGWWLLGTLSFVYLNTLLLRTLHAMTGVAFNAHALFHDDLVQTCLSIFWTLLGMTFFIISNRQERREPWLIGMGLVAVVVAKLFLIDLANSGTVERIVSFIAVGLLLLAVGYLMPLPEKDESAEERG